MPSVPGGTPIALGRVNVDASQTPETILKNFTAVDTEAKRIALEWTGKVSAITIQADPGNTGNLYVGVATMDISNAALPGVLGILSPGGSITLTSIDSGNLYNLGDIFIDAATNDDGGIVSAVRI